MRRLVKGIDPIDRRLRQGEGRIARDAAGIELQLLGKRHAPGAPQYLAAVLLGVIVILLAIKSF